MTHWDVVEGIALDIGLGGAFGAGTPGESRNLCI